MFKYTQASFFRSLPIMLMLLIQTKIVCQENNLLKIEQDLRYLEINAIENILKGFPLIPNNECINILRDIEDVRNITKNKLFNNIQEDFCFQPKNEDLSFILFNNQPEITLDILSFYTKYCAQLLNIRPGAICCAISTYEQREKVHKGTSAFVISQDFAKEDTLTIYFNLDNFNKEHSVFHVLLPFIMHELIHGIEAHAMIAKILENNVKNYYPEQSTKSLSAHPLFIALEKSHELIADVAPRILSPQLALLEANRHFCHRWGIIRCECTDNIHPTVHEVNGWNEKIIKCHENINFYDTLTFPFKAPQIRSLLIKKIIPYAVGISCFLIGGIIGKNINKSN